MAKSAAINMRVEPEEQALVDRAAALKNLDRSAFIMGAACERAEQVILEQSLLQFSDDQLSSFMTALEQPLRENPALKKLLGRKPQWD
jgi:uncharacterized protein (DUF1778 family)